MSSTRTAATTDAAAAFGALPRVETPETRAAMLALVAELAGPVRTDAAAAVAERAKDFPTTAAALATANDAAPIDYSRAAREAHRADAPTVYVSERSRAIRADYAAAAHLGHPEARADAMTDAAAAHDIEDLRQRARRAGRDRERLARLAAEAARRRDHYAATFDPDPRRFGDVAELFAALSAMLAAAVTFLRALDALVLALAARAAELAVEDGPARAPYDTGPPLLAADLLTVTLTAAPAAPPRAAVAART